MAGSSSAASSHPDKARRAAAKASCHGKKLDCKKNKKDHSHPTDFFYGRRNTNTTFEDKNKINCHPVRMFNNPFWEILMSKLCVSPPTPSAPDSGSCMLHSIVGIAAGKERQEKDSQPSRWPRQLHLKPQWK